MITIRPSQKRGSTELEWLKSKHTFSFGDYYDPDFLGFRSLRVINEDIVAPGKGFGMHSHRDMEIVTVVLGGALQHADSLGTGSVIRAGTVQRMTAGSGIRHSEFNASASEPVHFLQIWVEPARRGREPSYQEAVFEFRGAVASVAAPEGEEAAVTINQDVRISIWKVTAGTEMPLTIKPGRAAWLQVMRGTVTLNAVTAHVGDGVAVTEEELVTVKGLNDSEVLLFDLS
jgi:redox-sensitive bicupin YhaK (pirin superfamily)